MKKYFNLTNKSFQEEGVSSCKELWEKIKDDHEGLVAEFPVEIKKSGTDDKKVFDVIFSTADEDRHGDIVVQNFEIKNFKKNPILLDSHNYSSIAHILGKVSNLSQDKNLQGQIEFAKMNPKGVLAEEMADAGFINTTSIGFIPLEFDKDGKILKSELLEISLVSVPANARALFQRALEEVKEEEEVIEDVIEETIVETVKTLDRKKVILNSIAKAVKELEGKNMSEKKRQIFKSLRALQ